MYSWYSFQQLGDDGGSPVDIAKTYMRARPPWQSPILSSIGFKTPPTGMLLFKDETPSIIRADLSSATQVNYVLKKKYHR